MKIALFGITSLPLGRHNLKDPRLDQADQLVPADKKAYAQVDVADDKEIPTADAILTSRAAFSDLLMLDLEFVETRLGRGPEPAEKAVLDKLAEALISEIPVCRAGLTPEQLAAISAHNFTTSKPVTVAEEAELAAPDGLLLRAFKDAGYICFLTVGGKENRAWPIRAGATAAEAAGTIHTDLQKGLVRAEVISFADFVECGGETGAKRAGKMRPELKTYVMQDCDITNFRSSK
jgi:hypothetical protein